MEREELQAYEAGERFRKLAGARGEEPGMRPVVKKNACGIWVKNALRARGEEFLPEAGMERCHTPGWRRATMVAAFCIDSLISMVIQGSYRMIKQNS